MIYFIEAVGPGHIKIGFTDKPMAIRLALLQTGNSFPLRVLGTRPGPQWHERQLHRQFRASRIRGEWFKPVPQLLELIRTETNQFRTIELMDLLLGKKLTRYSINDLVYSNGLFNWKRVFDEIARRLGAGETTEVVAATCRLEVDGSCLFLGWMEGRSRKRYQRLYYLLFEREHQLYRYSGYFDPERLPQDVSKSLKSLPARPGGFRSVCCHIWEQAMGEWSREEDRLYL